MLATPPRAYYYLLLLPLGASHGRAGVAGAGARALLRLPCSWDNKASGSDSRFESVHMQAASIWKTSPVSQLS